MKRIKKTHLLLLIIFIAVLLWLVIRPANYWTWLAEVSPGLVIIAAAIILYNKFRLTTLSYTLIVFLVILMMIGGHYTYADVPPTEWLQDHFHLDRNYYDRFGHFMKGLCVIVIREILLRRTGLIKGKGLALISISIVMAIGAVYEIVEWLAHVVTLGSLFSKQFLATQGDMWDSQTDLACLLVGSTLSYLLLAKWHNKVLERENLY